MPPMLRAASVLPVPILTRFHLCGSVDHRPGGAALLLKCTFILIIDFKMPLLPLSGSTGQGIWVGGVSTELRGRGQIHPEVICCKQEGSRTQACPHTLCPSLAQGRLILAQSHVAVVVPTFPGY